MDGLWQHWHDGGTVQTQIVPVKHLSIFYGGSQYAYLVERTSPVPAMAAYNGCNNDFKIYLENYINNYWRLQQLPPATGSTSNSMSVGLWMAPRRSLINCNSYLEYVQYCWWWFLSFFRFNDLWWDLTVFRFTWRLILHGLANWVMGREYGSLGDFDFIDGSYGSHEFYPGGFGIIWDLNLWFQNKLFSV